MPNRLVKKKLADVTKKERRLVLLTHTSCCTLSKFSSSCCSYTSAAGLILQLVIHTGKWNLRSSVRAYSGTDSQAHHWLSSWTCLPNNVRCFIWRVLFKYRWWLASLVWLYRKRLSWKGKQQSAQKGSEVAWLEAESHGPIVPLAPCRTALRALTRWLHPVHAPTTHSGIIQLWMLYV